MGELQDSFQDTPDSRIQKESITVEFLFEQLTKTVLVPLDVVEEGDMGRLVVESNLHRPGLALAG
ncbi:MAG: hypothetical protein ACC655_08990, partial [Rhodothermia bacterium]